MIFLGQQCVQYSKTKAKQKKPRNTQNTLKSKTSWEVERVEGGREVFKSSLRIFFFSLSTFHFSLVARLPVTWYLAPFLNPKSQTNSNVQNSKQKQYSRNHGTHGIHRNNKLRKLNEGTQLNNNDALITRTLSRHHRSIYVTHHSPPGTPSPHGWQSWGWETGRNNA